MENGKLGGIALAAAAASLFLAACTTNNVKPAEVTQANNNVGSKIKCYGSNSCKGNSSCKSAMNECKGQNKCSGQGWTWMGEAECITMLMGKRAPNT
jgi:uncharacterized membrane protein